MIDFTPTLSRSYSRLIESEDRSEAEVDMKAAEILRGLSNMDMSEVLYDLGEQIRDLVRDGDELEIGRIVAKEVNEYARSVAERAMGMK